MPKPYNPNTKYGRKKLREQAEQYRQNLPTSERESFDSWGIVILLIIAAIAIFIFLASGNSGALKWLSR